MTRQTWVVFYGPRIINRSCKVFYTEYHAEQFARALELNGTDYCIVEGKETL